MDLFAVTRPKMMKSRRIKFLMHPNKVLCKIRIVETSYSTFNYKNIIDNTMEYTYNFVPIYIQLYGPK
jgi:hypothetical protein